MSNIDLLSPLPKPWSNINVNSIDANIISGNPIISNIEGPLTVSANVGNSSPPILKLVTENNGANNVNVALQSSNFDNSAVFQINSVNQPSPSSGLVTLQGPLFITTFGAANHITFFPGVAQAMDLQALGGGQTLVTIQNIKMNAGGTPGYVPTSLNYYEELNMTIGFEGPWGGSVFNRNCAFTRIGRMVTLKIDSVIQSVITANVNIFTLTAVPARFRPVGSADSVNSDFIINVVTGGFTNGPSLGVLKIDNTGLIGIFPANVNVSVSAPLPSVTDNSVYYPPTIGFKTLALGGFENLSISYSV